jgi:hypothetical protein
MDDAKRPLLTLVFVLLVLLGLMLVNPNFDKSVSVFAENASTVSDIGLRFTLQR